MNVLLASLCYNCFTFLPQTFTAFATEDWTFHITFVFQTFFVLCVFVDRYMDQIFGLLLKFIFVKYLFVSD